MAASNLIDNIVSPTKHDIDLARISAPVLSQILGRHRDESAFDETVAFLNENGERVVLPASALELLKNILVQMAQGNAVTLVPVHAELTTQQAAEMLNVSRPFFVKLLEERQIPFSRKGTHRRVLFSDVQAYKAKIDEERMKVLDELSEQAQELGMGY
ncbi:helix-turn-helix domain-containing protein [Alteromonas sp. NFXS44]|uniref:helix-turn-helix domain-containing protein n=1 Tax=Alteromonas sp. NFXS44 TaxID=2818435 RepID=UPI0032E00185